MKINRIRNVFPNLQIARYNLAAWQKSESDSIFLIGREVSEPGGVGQPDSGILKLFEVNADGSIAHERLIWKPMYDGINLEDPRALEIDGQNLVIGLTAVLRDKNGTPIPFPAIIKVDSHSTWQQELPPFLIISSFGPGKNLTPLTSSAYLFRPDDPDYHHKLLVFSLHRQVPEILGDIIFPTNLPWAQWRIGTTMPPIWITETEALFIIHGITIEQDGDSQKYIYSIGRAKLTKLDDRYTVTVAPDPILTPFDFEKPDGTPLVPELHPESRRVVYSCGGLIKRNNADTFVMYVNVGDRATFEVDFSLTELKAGLF